MITRSFIRDVKHQTLCALADAYAAQREYSLIYWLR